MYQYGLMMLRGNGIQKNIIKGIEYLKKSADFGNEKAMYKYGNYLYNNSKEIESALYYLKKSSNQGYVKSMFLYSILLKNNHKCDEDLLESTKYMRRAAFFVQC